MCKNSNLVIRPATISDAAALNAIYSGYIADTAITFEDDILTDGQFAARMKDIMAFYPYFVAESGGEIVGYAYAGKFKNRSAYDWSVESTVYVKRGAQRMGTGSALYAALEEALKSQGIINMYACIAVPEVDDEFLTHGSVYFHERMGFKIVGEFVNCGCKFGRWYNMVWMQKLLGEHESDPERPVPYSCVYQK